MTFREWLARRLWPGVAQEQRASSTAGMVYAAASGYAIDQPSDTPTELGHASSHPYFFSCADTIAKAAMAVPLRVYELVPTEAATRNRDYVTSANLQRAKALRGIMPLRQYRALLNRMNMGLKEVYDAHPLTQLLSHVNDNDTWPEFIQRSMLHLIPTGDYYWEMVGGKGGKPPSELWILRPDRVKILPDAKRYVGGYEFEMNGETLKLDADQVLHVRMPHPENDFYGLSRVDALALVLETDRQRAIYNAGFFRNGAQMSGIFTPKAGVQLGVDEWRKHMDLFREKYIGAANAGKVGMFGVPVEFSQTSVNPRDAEFSGMKEENEHDISGVTGVPRALTGRTSDVNRSNMDVLQTLFWSQTMVPLLMLVCARINVGLASRYGDTIVVEPDFSGIDALSEETSEKSSREMDAYDKGIKTLNEARQALGEDPIDGGDVLKIASGAVLVPVASIGEAPEVEPDTEPLPEPETPQRSAQTHVFGDAEHLRIYGLFQEAVDPFVRNLNRSLVGYWQGQQDGVLSALNEQKAFVREVIPERVLFDIDEQQRILWEVVSDHSGAALEKAGANVIADLGISLTFDPENPLVLAHLREKELLIKTIPESMHERLRTQLVEGNRRGESIAEIKQRIEVLYSDAKGNVSARIAQTEIVGAYNVGGMAGMVQAGVSHKTWIATLDDRVRDSHAALHGQTLPIDEPFANGLLYPGAAGGGAGEVINCRCTITAAFVAS
ncbi:MAG: phage portal protein [Bacteroidales bacterium]|nr:phage portal protein [Bacteroidales bacterium]